MDELANPAGQPEKKHPLQRPNRLIILEGVALLFSAPFLLFPESFPLLTAAGLIGLGIAWLVPIILRSRANLPITPFNLTFLLWGLWLITSTLVTADPADTLPKTTGLILGLAAWHFMAVVINSNKLFRGALVTTLAIATVFSLVGLAALDLIIKIPALAFVNPVHELANPIFRDLAIHPNQLAGLICLYLPLLVSLLFAGRRTEEPVWIKVMTGILLLVSIMILLLTQSRGGWIAAVTGLYALVIMWSVILPPSQTRQILRGLSIAVALLFGFAVLWIGPLQLADFWLNPPAETVVGTMQTLNYRRELWPYAIKAIGDFPFTGTGLGAFRQVAFRLYPLAFNPRLDIGHAHNIFLQTALDVGLPGLITYLAVIILAGVLGWRVARRSAALRPAALGLLAGLVALHVFGLADALALGSKPGIVLWLYLGLLTGMNRIVSDKEKFNL